MLIIHDIHNFQAPWAHSCLTLGVFDGMHRGHQALIHELNLQSVNRDYSRVLLSYHPHPDIVLGKKNNHNGLEIFTYEEKLALFQKFKLDAVIFLPFTKELARMHALKYLKYVLIEKLKAARIIIGYDQCFGRNRQGNIKLLKAFAPRYKYEVEQIQPVKYEGVLVSSSLVRELVYKGDIASVNKYLGHTYFITGTVIQGKARGRTLGFPTANIALPETKALLGKGVYFAMVHWGSHAYKAMVNIGHNPTFGHQQLIVEAHILDFNQELYGEQLKLYFYKRLRDEIKFAGPQELKKQLLNDLLQVQNLEPA